VALLAEPVPAVPLEGVRTGALFVGTLLGVFLIFDGFEGGTGFTLTGGFLSVAAGLMSGREVDVVCGLTVVLLTGFWE
jgi:hypothetical protein